jgi:hypothetical protein
MIIQCDVGIFGVELFRKLWASLNQGGRLVIVDHFSPAENAVPASRLEWSFLDSLEDPNFSIPTMEKVREQLVQAGLQTFTRENILPNNWTVSQGSKET